MAGAELWVPAVVFFLALDAALLFVAVYLLLRLLLGRERGQQAREAAVLVVGSDPRLRR